MTEIVEKKIINFGQIILNFETDAQLIRKLENTINNYLK